MRAGYKLAEDMKLINHLLFINDLKLYRASKAQLDSLVQVVRIFSQDFKMSFGLDKCAVLEMRQAAYRGNRGGRLQIPWHLTVGPDSQHQDER